MNEITRQMLSAAKGEKRLQLIEMDPTEEELIWLKTCSRFKSGGDYLDAVSALKFKREWEATCRRINPKAWEAKDQEEQA